MMLLVTLSNYISSPEIDQVLELAQFLQKPILIEGPSGTGKTSLAISVAEATKRELIRIQCFEGISSAEIIGEWNYHKQLIRIQLASHQRSDQSIVEDVFSTDYFIPRPLMQAFISSQKPVVLLIDEIDRSDEEFEAFLLEALGEKQITIPELGTFQAKRDDLLVFLTSNATRELSEALRRRCLFLYLDFPSIEREKKIVQLHCPSADERLINDVVNIVHELHKPETGLRKVPSIAETVEWCQTLLRRIEKTSNTEYETTLNVVIKYREDLEKAKLMLNKEWTRT